MKSMPKLFLSLVLILCLLFSVSPVRAEQPEEGEPLPVLYLHQINNGCAAAYMITAGNTVILVDCGSNTLSPEAGARVKPLLDYFEAAGIDHIDLWFVTHYHNDHAMNLNSILEVYGTDETRVFGPSEVLPERFLPLAAGSYTQLKEYDSFAFGDFDFLCLGPATVKARGEINADSLNVRLDYGDFSFLITGDNTPKNIVKRHGDEIANIDVITYPHHGLAPLLLSDAALAHINPACILIASDTAGRVRVQCNHVKLNPEIMCGGKNGNVVVRAEGSDIEVFANVQPGEYPYSPVE